MEENLLNLRHRTNHKGEKRRKSWQLTRRAETVGVTTCGRKINRHVAAYWTVYFTRCLLFSLHILSSICLLCCRILLLLQRPNPPPAPPPGPIKPRLIGRPTAICLHALSPFLAQDAASIAAAHLRAGFTFWGGSKPASLRQQQPPPSETGRGSGGTGSAFCC